jgi:mannose-1-phosphate guanylyltransferase
MKVLMTCAGINTELRPFTDMMPKCLLPINSRSILYRNLDWLHKFDVEGIVISSSYRHNQLKLSLDSYKSKIPIHFHREPKIVGTAQTLKNMHYKFDDVPFVFLHGDNLYDFDLNDVYDKHLKTNKMITVICYKGKGRHKKKNIVKFEDKKSTIEKIIVNPGHTSDYEVVMTAGAFISNPTIHSKISSKDYDLFEDVLPNHVNNMNAIIEENIKLFNTSNEYMATSNTWSSCDFVYY